MAQIIPIKLPEVRQAATVLQESFQDFGLIRWVFLDDLACYQQYSLCLFEAWVRYAIRYGLALRTQGFEACLLCKKPGDTGFSLWRALRSAMWTIPWLIERRCLQRLHAVSKANLQVRALLKDLDFWYCWAIGVKPLEQGKGFYKQLMAAYYDIADHDQLPCYLETLAGSGAEKIHKHQGFNAIKTVDIAGEALQISGMLREASLEA